VPNCYYVVTSTPEGTASDVRECVPAGGRVRPVGWGRRKGRYLVLVWFRTDEEAEANLDKIKDCLEGKGHTVHDHDVLDDGAEFALTEEA
jgi:hypothetical protein